MKTIDFRYGIVIFAFFFSLCSQVQKVTGKSSEEEKKKKEQETVALLLWMQNESIIQTSANIMIPAYFYDSYYWQPLIQTMNHRYIVIINPDNGPGTNSDPLYDQYRYWIDQTISRGGNPIGYVYTSYGNRPEIDIKNDIDTWLSIYPDIKGFFLDEASSDSGKISVYQNIYNYIKNKNPDYIIMLNHGIIPNSNFFDVADINLVYENSPSGLVHFSATLEMWNYERSHFSMIVHSAKKEDFRQIFSIAEENHIGYIFITDDILPNPFDTLPTYWDEFVSIFQ